MTTKSFWGAVLTGLVLFVYGFIYWAVNPLPYLAWNDVDDMAATQSAAAQLFPEDGVYFLPGAGNDPEAMKLLETGPSVFLTIDHSPVAGPDPLSLAMGFMHNVFSALLLVFVLSGVSGHVARITRAMIIGVVAAFVINGSEIIWWQQPVNWVAHQTIYYIIYFGIGAGVLHYFLDEPDGETEAA